MPSIFGAGVLLVLSLTTIIALTLGAWVVVVVGVFAILRATTRRRDLQARRFTRAADPVEPPPPRPNVPKSPSHRGDSSQPSP